MEQPGLHGRHRDKNGEISRKHGNTLVGTLRKIYGAGFAQGYAPTTTLAELLGKTGEPTLSQLHWDLLHKDHDAGTLPQKIAAAD